MKRVIAAMAVLACLAGFKFATTGRLNPLAGRVYTVPALFAAMSRLHGNWGGLTVSVRGTVGYYTPPGGGRVVYYIGQGPLPMVSGSLLIGPEAPSTLVSFLRHVPFVDRFIAPPQELAPPTVFTVAGAAPPAATMQPREHIYRVRLLARPGCATPPCASSTFSPGALLLDAAAFVTPVNPLAVTRGMVFRLSVNPIRGGSCQRIKERLESILMCTDRAVSSR